MTGTEHRTDFFVIGVVKGGTTSLYDYLNQHHDIYLPPIKEINHFSKADINSSQFLPGYARDVRIDLKKYLASGMKEMVHIAHVEDDVDYASLYEPMFASQRSGDISNSYMICPSSAAAIAEYNPDAKVIVVLRNPIRRLWSQFLMNVREDKIKSEDLAIELEHDKSSDAKGWGANHQYLELGMYSEQLSKYYALFPKAQILPVIFEEYVKEPQKALKSISEFIGVNSDFKFDTEGKKNSASLPRNKVLNQVLVRSGIIKLAKGIIPRSMRGKLGSALYSSKNIPSISEQDSDFLRDFYAEEVLALSTLIGRDMSHVWTEFKVDA